MRVVAQPGHWLGPVTRLGRLGYVGCAGPSLKNNKKIEKNKK